MSAIRDYVLGLFRRGALASLEEGALVAGVSRVTVRTWLLAARIDWRAQRSRFIARHRRRAVMVSEGRIVRRPTKGELHRQADQAKAQWDRGHDRP